MALHQSVVKVLASESRRPCAFRRANATADSVMILVIAAAAAG
jgi:hypothetical protein